MSQTPAGWYPAEEGRIRWWDGAMWTEHYQDQQLPAPVAAEPVAVEPAVVEPVIVDPVAVEPIAVQPIAVEPIAVQPIAVEPIALEPVVEVPASPPPVFEAPASIPPIAPASAIAQPPIGVPPAAAPYGVETPATTPYGVPQQPANPYGAPAYGAQAPAAGGVPPIPTPGGVPGYAAGGAAAYGAAPGAGGGLPPGAPKKKGLLWLWLLLGGIALLFIIGVIVVIAVVVPAIVNAGPTPEPITIETIEPVDPTDPGDFSGTDLALIDAVREEFPDTDITDDEIVALGTDACVVASDNAPVTAEDVIGWATTTTLAIFPEEFADAGDDGLAVIIDTAILGEIGVNYSCGEHYDAWWDAVEEIITSTN